MKCHVMSSYVGLKLLSREFWTWFCGTGQVKGSVQNLYPVLPITPFLFSYEPFCCTHKECVVKHGNASVSTDAVLKLTLNLRSVATPVQARERAGLLADPWQRWIRFISREPPPLPFSLPPLPWWFTVVHCGNPWFITGKGERVGELKFAGGRTERG